EKTDRDTDDSQEKSVVEKIKNSNQFLAELMHSVKNEKFAAKDSANAENSVNSNKAYLSEQLKLAVQKNGALDDKEVFVLNEYAKELKERFEDPELLSAQALSVQEPASFIKQVSGEASAKRSDVNVKEIKSKKEVKKFSDVFSVTDLRTEKKASAVAEKKTDFVTSVKQTASDTVQVTMDLSSQAEKNILSLNGQAAGAQGSTFQAMLENQIAENAGDFVKAGNIVLKDNNVGKINLILHPENLGNVKISLELSDKVVTGKILVTSQEAFNAFNSTQEHLKTAFIESGFDNASFDVAFANQNQNFASSGQNENQNARQAVNAYGELVVENISVDENISDTLNDVRDYSINIVA
ncbi:flagellar hook-length control protein FliK, partial [Treponema sp.]|uniref:flagellar hook-length control protein FliK n=1 Tax=Treponema sp. TaxID=166 RepID=UPI00298DDCB4